MHTSCLAGGWQDDPTSNAGTRKPGTYNNDTVVRAKLLIAKAKMESIGRFFSSSECVFGQQMLHACTNFVLLSLPHWRRRFF